MPYWILLHVMLHFSGPICSLPSQRFASDFQSSEITKWPKYRMLWCRFTTTMNLVSTVSNSLLMLLELHSTACIYVF